jgi:hypothetical protein
MASGFLVVLNNEVFDYTDGAGGQSYQCDGVSAGDYNHDGGWMADYVVWRKTFGSTVAPLRMAPGTNN